MSENKQHGHKDLTLADNVGAFFLKFRIFFFVALGTLLVSIIAFLVFSAISTAVKTANPLAAETIEKDYASWKVLASGSEKDTKTTELLKAIDNLVAQNGLSFSAQRGLIVKANILFESKKYAEAIDIWLLINKNYSDSVFAEISLYNAAVAAEEMGDNTKAIELYTKYVALYTKKAPNVATALFNLFRLYEDKKDYTAVKTTYNTLKETYPNTSWTNLAESRIIYLVSEGLVKE